MGVPSDLLDRVLALDSTDRAELAYQLLGSLEPEPDAADLDYQSAWRDEIERRIQEIDEGRAVLLSEEEVDARLRATLERVRSERLSAPGQKP